ncbi:MAG: dienelactone hydrolase family protein [Gemmatimonadetes bacterium]|nr:dienelactone hydrolase family protein [Gemmatimonadota bacterium]
MTPYDLSRALVCASFTLLLASGGCVSVSVHNRTATETGEPGRQVARTIDVRVERRFAGEYLIYLPADYDPSRKWPLLLFLHGAGERGNDVGNVAFHGPPKLIREATMDLPFIVVSPQVPEDRIWSVRFLDAVLEEIARSHSVDEDRVYVTGLSMGGYGTWELAMEFPHRFAAIAPISGGGTMPGACTLRHLPIWAFHGALDQVVPPWHTEDFVTRLRACDGRIRYTRYEDAGHDAWTRTYANPGFYEWLLSHRRGAPAPRDPQDDAG